MTRSITINRRTLFAGTGAAALVAMLAACGSDSEGSPSGSGKGGKGTFDTLTVAFPSSLANLYPGKEGGITNYFVGALTLEGLVALDDAGTIVGALAESWEETSPTTYAFNLRAGAKFTDGTAVTVEDVIASYEVAKNEKISPSASYYWSEVTKVEKTGDAQVTFTLASADVSFLYRVAGTSAFWVMPKTFIDTAADDLGTAKSLIVGSGPYKVTSFTPDSGIVLEAVDTWWGGKVGVKQLKIEFIAEEQTRLLGRQDGAIDIALRISPDQAEQWAAAPDTEIALVGDRVYVGIDFNTAVAPYDDIHVRRAFGHLIDREAIVKSILKGYAEPATALTTPDEIAGVVGGRNAAVEKLNILPEMAFDVAAAKAELAQSKVPNGFKTVVGVSSSMPTVSLAFQAIAESAKEIGIEIEVKEMPTEQWYGTIGSPDWGLAYMEHTNTAGDPAELAKWFLAEGNPASYTNKTVAGLLNDAKVEVDPAKRVDIIVEMQKVAFEDLPYIPLWWGKTAHAIDTSIEFKEIGANTFLGPWPAQVTERG